MSWSEFDSYPAVIGRTDLKFLGVYLVAAALCGYLFYQWLLPKPIPGIPYNEEAAHRLLGDLPAMMKDVKSGKESFLTWIEAQFQAHKSPIIQIFFRPFSKPTVIISDFREAQDILMRRKDFDRSFMMGTFFRGIMPNHHISEPTNKLWKAHRSLLHDLMSPSFLHNVAGPVIHSNAETLIQLWKLKSAIADGRPFEAIDDVYEAALDAVLAFAFGKGFPHSALGPKLEFTRTLNDDAINGIRSGAETENQPVQFPQTQRDPAITATLDLTSAMEQIVARPFSNLWWKYLASKPKMRQAWRIKNQYITRELESAVKRLDSTGSSTVRSAVDHMMQRETKLAEKEGRAPDYLSPVMVDETFGFVIGGHDTTSTTVLWGLKLLADNPACQTKLRSELAAALPEAWALHRDPSIGEITGTNIPYLDAAMEEILRCSGTIPLVDREAMCDTEVLGYPIKKGTNVTILSTGPGMLSPGFDIDESRRGEGSRAAKAEGRDRAWDPEDIGVFKPERWLAPALSHGAQEESQGRPGAAPYDFDSTAGPQLAFSLGTRGCFGKRLAYVELRIMLTLIVWNFEMLKCPEELSAYVHVPGITHKPEHCYVRLRTVHPN